MKNFFPIICLLIVIAIASIGFHHCRDEESTTEMAVRVDTVTIYDTIRITTPTPTATTLTQVVLDRFPIIHDTIYSSVPDTATVAIPIEQNYYRDSLYEAWVSGYRATLDSLHIYAPSHTVTIDRTVDRVLYRTRRWGVGVQAGIGLTPKGAAPFIGVGVTYNIWTF
ncbi:MAG: hypothetical protein NC111_06410 [Bacteroides sp.]|nr:hypothetical protein [Bacteroides sp.]MCM1413120.1 hypothetical protein [Bacteroides sp.]MCM1472138.1 hypothetical protein [Bacteroides sp.]